MKKSDHVRNQKLREEATNAVVAVLRTLYEGEIAHKVHSSVVSHTLLQPEGIRYSIQLVIEVQEKEA